ncbi:MAG: MerR family transcriptional regulator [Chloroflexi bacterium]|nr:MerR family transcriptional regulator [Chloroflexota bacterium]
MSRYYRIGDFARMCGVSPRTVDYYTRLGLISPCSRSSGSHRLYDGAAVRQMHRIKDLQARRLTLEEIASLVGDAGLEGPDALPRLRQIEEELARLDREVASLQPKLAELTASGRMHPAMMRTLSAAITSALALANQLSCTLAEGGIPY